MLTSSLEQYKKDHQLDDRLTKMSVLLPPLNMEKGPWLAGGSLLRWATSEVEADYDLFFSSDDQLQQYRRDLIDLHGDRLTEVLASQYALTFELRYGKKTYKIQLILLDFYPTPEEVLNRFDLTVCQWITDLKVFSTGLMTMLDVKERVLRCNKVLYGPAVLRRLHLYQNRGYKLTFDSCKEFLQQIVANPKCIELRAGYEEAEKTNVSVI